jgi:hypothetical protein
LILRHDSIQSIFLRFFPGLASRITHFLKFSSPHYLIFFSLHTGHPSIWIPKGSSHWLPLLYSQASSKTISANTICIVMPFWGKYSKLTYSTLILKSCSIPSNITETTKLKLYVFIKARVETCDWIPWLKCVGSRLGVIESSSMKSDWYTYFREERQVHLQFPVPNIIEDRSNHIFTRIFLQCNWKFTLDALFLTAWYHVLSYPTQTFLEICNISVLFKVARMDPVVCNWESCALRLPSLYLQPST